MLHSTSTAETNWPTYGLERSAYKMKVRSAAQILRHSVAAGIYTRIATQELPADARFTADLLELVEFIIVICWKGFPVFDNKRKQLQKPKNWVSKWKFIGARSGAIIHCHWGMQTTIENCVTLSVCTARFNQDSEQIFRKFLVSRRSPTNEIETDYKNTILLIEEIETCSIVQQPRCSPCCMWQYRPETRDYR